MGRPVDGVTSSASHMTRLPRTIVPLDMIFIRLNGEIESIVTREDTLSQERTRSQKPVAYVLEINAGQSAVLGIKPGHFIRLESSGGSR